MAGAGLDEGVGNLQRFIAGLVSATAALGQASSSVGALASDFESAADEVGRVGDGLNGDLDDAADSVDQFVEEACEAVEALGEAADDGSSDSLAAAQEAWEGEAEACDAQTAEGRAILEDGHAGLAESGFEAHGTALQSALRDALTARDEATTSFEKAGQEWEDGGEALQEDCATLAGAQDEAAEGMAGDAAEIGESLAAARESWKKTIHEELCEGAEETGSAVAADYASWSAAAATTAEALKEDVTKHLDGSASLVRSRAVEALAQGMASSLTAPAHDLLERYEQTGEALEAGTSLAGELAPLVPDLQRALAIIEEVDRLLNVVA